MIRKLFEKRSSDYSIDNQKLAEIFGLDLSGMSVNGFNSLKETTVYICTKIRAESVAKLPLKLYKDKEVANNHELFYLLKVRPNPYMSSINFWKCIETQRTIKGNAYAYINRDKRGQIISLMPLESDNVKVIVDDIGILGTENKLMYIVKHQNKEYKIFPDEMLHFVGDITLNGIVGVSPIDYLKCLVENGKATGEFMNKFFKNGLSVKGLIQYVGELNEDAKRTFVKEFESMSNGLSNAHSVSMLPVGYQFQPISLSMADAQFLENSKLTYRQIAAVFGIKSHQINDMERATYTNIVEQQNDYYISSLQPTLAIYEQELNYKTLSDNEFRASYYWKFNVDSILRTSLKDRYEAYRVGIQASLLKPNEARAKEDMDPAEGGDQLLCNGNMMPVTMAGRQYLKGGEKDE